MIGITLIKYTLCTISFTLSSSYVFSEKNITVDTNSLNNRYSGKWRGVMIIYDLEKSIRDYIPREVSEGLAPSLSFESRFECGNLRQARRM